MRDWSWKTKMRTIATEIYRVTRAGETLFISLKEVPVAEFDESDSGDPSMPLEIITETADIPVVPSEIHLWDGGDGLYPHLHYTCPRCQQIHNVDLYGHDLNPRFGVCDSCGWDSLVWIEWDERARATMDLDKGRYLAREIEAMRRETPSVSQIDGLTSSLESFAETHPDGACRLVIELWPIASAVFTPEKRRTTGPWMDEDRSPNVVARLRQLAASDADLELRDACRSLLENLKDV